MNKITIWLTIIAISLIIVIPTGYKIVNDNHQKLYLVVEKLVTENAEKCVYDQKCKGKKVTLKELYDNGYIKEDVINPVTKSVYSEKSYIIVKKNKSKFYPA